MKESTIVILLIIFISIYITYKKPIHEKKCATSVTYFDNLYYNLPKSDMKKQKTMEDNSMNDLITSNQQMRPKRSIGDKNNKTQMLWASKHDLHEKEVTGSNAYTNTDKEIIPTDIHHQLKEKMSNVVRDTGNSKSYVDSFESDTWTNPNFDYNKKFNEGLISVGNNFYEI